MSESVKPKKISVRPGNTLEGDHVDIVWVYHRKVQVQMAFPSYSASMEENIDEAVAAWRHAMEKL